MNYQIKPVLVWVLLITACTFAAEEKKIIVPDSGLTVIARLTEIPGGAFPDYPKNSIYYNHVAVLRYEVLRVEQGTCKEKILMVGHYMPRLARSAIKDKMQSVIKGNVASFEEDAVHRLILDKPISKYWLRDDAVFDEYFDEEEGARWFALKTDLAETQKE